MKKTAPAIVSLVLGIAIGFFICKEFYCPKLDCSTCEPDCSNCPTTGACAPTTTPPPGIISINEAVNLHESYVGEHYQAINNAMGEGFLDTQFVWFEYDRIKSYIGYLEAVQDKNPNNEPISGIRVYFGAYGDGNDLYPKQQTVFFTPTVDTKLNENNSNMKNLPFYIQPSSSNDPLVGTYKIIGGLLIDQYNPDERAFMANSNLNGKNTREGQATAQKSAQAKDGNGGTSLSYNMGQLSPPPRG